jgi:hypothetical protein
LLQLHIDNWSTFYPPIHTNLIIILKEQSIIAGDNPNGPWAPLDYPSVAALIEELGDLCYDWNDPNHDDTQDAPIDPNLGSTDTQWEPLTYPDLTEFVEEVQDFVMPFFIWGDESSEEDISPCPSPPPPLLPPLAPPPLPPFLELERYIRDTRPDHHRLHCPTRNIGSRLIIGFHGVCFIIEPGAIVGLDSVDWNSRMADIQTYRTMRNPRRTLSIQEILIEIDITKRTIFNIPQLLYRNLDRPHMTADFIQRLENCTPYVETYPDSDIAVLVNMTKHGLIDVPINWSPYGLIEERNMTISCVNEVYRHLHIMVEQEIENRLT